MIVRGRQLEGCLHRGRLTADRLLFLLRGPLPEAHVKLGLARDTLCVGVPALGHGAAASLEVVRNS